MLYIEFINEFMTLSWDKYWCTDKWLADSEIHKMDGTDDWTELANIFNGENIVKLYFSLDTVASRSVN